MGWQSDIVKYGMIIGAAGVGVYVLSHKISGALSAPAAAAGETINAAGEALGTAASAVGETLGGAGEAAGNYVQTISNCPTCNGWPNLFGTPCEECAEHGQKELPGQVPPSGDAGDVYYQNCVGQMCDHTDAADANQGGDIKADKPIDVFEWKWPWDPVGTVTKVQDDPSQENWFKDPVPGILEAGADIQRFFFGGQTLSEVLKVDNVVEQAVPQGQDFTVPTGYRTGATGFKNTTESSTLNTGNNVLDGTAATVNLYKVHGQTLALSPEAVSYYAGMGVDLQPTYNNTVHANTSSNGLSSSTVVNTSAPSVTVNTAANANVNASSTQVNTSTNVAGSTGQAGARGARSGGSSSSGNSGGGSTTSTGGGAGAARGSRGKGNSGSGGTS